MEPLGPCMSPLSRKLSNLIKVSFLMNGYHMMQLVNSLQHNDEG